MSVDFTAPEGAVVPENEANMFAPTPVWARDSSRKRRGVRRSTTTSSADAPAANVAGAAAHDPELAADRPFVASTAPSRTPRRSNAAPFVIAGGVAAAAILGVAGWYAAQPRDGVAELTPGAPAPAAPAHAPVLAQTSPAPSTAPANAPAPQLAANTTAYGGGAVNSLPASTHPGRATAATHAVHRSASRASSSATTSDAASAGMDASAVEGAGSSASQAQTPAPMTAAPATSPPATSPTTQGGDAATAPTTPAMTAAPPASTQTNSSNAAATNAGSATAPGATP